jgi:hypothetical protein
MEVATLPAEATACSGVVPSENSRGLWIVTGDLIMLPTVLTASNKAEGISGLRLLGVAALVTV